MMCICRYRDTQSPLVLLYEKLDIVCFSGNHSFPPEQMVIVLQRAGSDAHVVNFDDYTSF